MIKYKLTDKDGYTRRGRDGETLWTLGCIVNAIGKGTKLCTSDVIHYYDSPEIAVFMNPVHGNIKPPLRCFEIEIDAIVTHDGTKGGCKHAKCLREVTVPKLSLTQMTHISIRCAMVVYKEASWVSWAENWLSGKDRTSKAAYIAANNIDPTYAFVDAAYAATATAAIATNTIHAFINVASGAFVTTITSNTTDVFINASNAARFAADICDVEHIEFDLNIIIHEVIENNE